MASRPTEEQEPMHHGATGSAPRATRGGGTSGHWAHGPRNNRRGFDLA